MAGSSWRTRRSVAAVAAAVLCAGAQARPRPPSEVLGQEEAVKHGVAWRGNSSEVSSHQLLGAPAEGMPDSYNWCDMNGTSYCTMSRNQHIPQYCGSCWAHGAVSALADRVKIARRARGADINPSVQHMLNCNGVGSCHGGFVDGPYQWLHKISKETGTGISYESAQPYMACSSESEEGICKGQDWSCTPTNIARTCSTFPPTGFCAGLSTYPNITISEYGSISGADAMMKEIYNRGPISCGIDANPLRTYTEGIVITKGEEVDHVISVVGWGTDAEKGKYWIVRNSWGEYWGEMGYTRVQFGALLVEDQCSWAAVDMFTTLEGGSMHCYEDGTNCKVAPKPSPSPAPGPAPSCADKETFCTDAAIFKPDDDCKILAKDCLRTCSCCGAKPPDYCSESAARKEVVV